MPKQWIKVGACSQEFDTIPVKKLIDSISQASKKTEALGWDRYQLLDIDGCYLVIHEWMNDKKAFQDYICFDTEKQAMDYLVMCGVEIEEA